MTVTPSHEPLATRVGCVIGSLYDRRTHQHRCSPASQANPIAPTQQSTSSTHAVRHTPRAGPSPPITARRAPSLNNAPSLWGAPITLWSVVRPTSGWEHRVVARPPVRATPTNAMRWHRMRNQRCLLSVGSDHPIQMRGTNDARAKRHPPITAWRECASRSATASLGQHNAHGFEHPASACAAESPGPARWEDTARGASAKGGQRRCALCTAAVSVTKASQPDRARDAGVAGWRPTAALTCTREQDG